MPELFSILDLSVMRLADGPVNRTFANGTYSIIDVWDEVLVQGTNLTSSTITNTITVNKAGFYEIKIHFNVSFPSNEELALYGFVNGLFDSSRFVSVQGQGNGKPVELFMAPIQAMQAGDIVDIRGTNRDNGSFECEILTAQLGMEFKRDLP